MPASKVNDEAVMEGLLRVFQDYGYEGATLARLSEATGLEKSSLYHRFPGGKEEMAMALLRHVEQRFAKEILAPLRGSGALTERIQKSAAGLKRFYDSGRRSCLLDTLSLCGGDAGMQQAVKQLYKGWRDALAEAAREAGLAPATARKRAEEVISSIHGTLILARITGERAGFLESLGQMESLLKRA
jgi:AcrR family transcriptional regulator